MLAHLRELASGRRETLLTATRRPEISEAAVLARLLWTDGVLVTVTAALGAPRGYLGAACQQDAGNRAISALALVRLPEPASPAVLRERACKKALTPGTSTVASLAISVVQ